MAAEAAYMDAATLAEFREQTLEWSAELGVWSSTIEQIADVINNENKARGVSIQCYFTVLRNLSILFWAVALASAPAVIFNGINDGLSSGCVIDPSAQDLSTAFLRFRLRTTLLNVDNYHNHAATQCPPAVDHDPELLYTGAVASWSVLLVLSTLGVLCFYQWTLLSIQAHRRRAARHGLASGEEVYTLWLSNLPVTAGRAELLQFLTAVSGDCELRSKLYSTYVHQGSGNAFVTFLYRNELKCFCDCLPPPSCCSTPDRVLMMGQELEACCSARAVEWSEGGAESPTIKIDSMAPAADDILWSSMSLDLGRRVSWRLGFLLVWAMQVVALFFILVFFLNLNDYIEAQGYNSFVTFLAEAIGTGSAVTILVLLVDLINYSLGWLQQHSLQSGYNVAMLAQSFYINTITTPLLATLMCLKGISLPGRLEFGENLVPRNVSYLVNTLFSVIFLNQLLSGWLQLPQRLSALLWDKCCWRGWFAALRSSCCWSVAKCCGAHSRTIKRKHLEQTAVAEFPLASKYVTLLYMVSLGLIFSPGVPISNLACAIALTHQYWADKYTLLRHCSMPGRIGYSEVLLMPQRALGLIRYVVLPLAVVFAYLWWVRCGPDGNTGKQISVHQAVADWSNWEQLSYYGIAPGICIVLLLLGDLVWLTLKCVLLRWDKDPELGDAREFQASPSSLPEEEDEEKTHIVDQLRRASSQYLDVMEEDKDAEGEVRGKGAALSPYEIAFREWEKSQVVEGDVWTSEGEHPGPVTEELELHINPVEAREEPEHAQRAVTVDATAEPVIRSGADHTIDS